MASLLPTRGVGSRGSKSSRWRQLFILAVCTLIAAWVWYSVHMIWGGGLSLSSRSLPMEMDLRPSETVHPGRYRPTELLGAKDVHTLNLEDYPCAENVATVNGMEMTGNVNTVCVIHCEGSPTCEAARDVCGAYVWCTHIILEADGTARLKHRDSDSGFDGSDSKLRALGLPRGVIDVSGGPPLRRPVRAGQPNDNNSIKIAAEVKEWTKKRLYIIVSLSADTGDTLADFLGDTVGPDYVQRVYKVFDPLPPAQLSIEDEETGSQILPLEKADCVRVVFLFDDPVNVLAAEYGEAFCRLLTEGLNHENGEDDRCSARLPDSYAALARTSFDHLQLARFYHAYLNRKTPRAYPIVAVNLQKAWDHTDVLLKALGLPAKPEWVAELKEVAKVKRRVVQKSHIPHKVAAQLRAGMLASVMPYIYDTDAVSIILQKKNEG